MELRWLALLLAPWLVGCATTGAMHQNNGAGEPAANKGEGGPPQAEQPAPSSVAQSNAPAQEGPIGPTLPPPLFLYERWRFLVRLEASGLAFLPRKGEGEREEGFAQIAPMMVVDKSERFGVGVGAPLRVRLFGGAPEAGLLRQEDWDSLSDFGQLVNGLRLGSDYTPVALWAGALNGYTLMSGHLVRRYSNRSNPDYHPAGAYLFGKLGPLYGEAFTSDVLGARIMGAEVELDVEWLLFGKPKQTGRYTLAFSAVHDWGRAEVKTPDVTLAHLDGIATLIADRNFELHVLAGWGGKPGTGGAWGVVAGLGMDAATEALDFRLRVEGRHQHGGFRQGYLGPDYELARFQAVGADGWPLAEESFPEGFSAYGELIVQWDAVWLGKMLQRHLLLTVGVEAFTWGRLDVDGRMAVQLANRNLELAVIGLAVGMNQPRARYLASGEVRWRFGGRSFYALGQGGTLLFPASEGTLRPGAFVAVGMGVDNAR